MLNASKYKMLNIYDQVSATFIQSYFRRAIHMEILCLAKKKHYLLISFHVNFGRKCMATLDAMSKTKNTFSLFYGIFP